MGRHGLAVVCRAVGAVSRPRGTEGTRALNAEQIARLWERELNAWPAQKQLLLDGWVLRFNEGYTGRANSVMPLRHGGMPVDEKIGVVEELYAGEGLPSMFCLHAGHQPADLDTALAERGYVRRVFSHCTTVSIRTADLRGLTLDTGLQVGLSTDCCETWLAGVRSCAGLSEQSTGVLRRMMSRLALEAGFGLLRDADGRAVSCGLAVLEKGWVGLLLIGTAERHRRQGYASALVSRLLDWASGRGADAAFLQVVANNAAAIRLYDRFGFEEACTYWYRVKP